MRQAIVASFKQINHTDDCQESMLKGASKKKLLLLVSSNFHHRQRLKDVIWADTSVALCCTIFLCHQIDHLADTSEGCHWYN